ncbi:MAG TPA: cytochrome-c peroxidase [Paracoccaceae bacterium]|nr:cytochrome-c peroxidase [Paracoccaceae bacterium]
MTIRTTGSVRLSRVLQALATSTPLAGAAGADPRRAGSGVFSCCSCRNLTTGGNDKMEVSVGHGWQKGPGHSPTVLKAARFRDGSAADLAAQAKGPVQGGVSRWPICPTPWWRR